MSGPYADSVTAIRALWTANWSPSVSGVVVRWQENANDQIPTADNWLHIQIEHGGEDLIAFGGGRAQNEIELQGRIIVAVMSKRGRGEADGLTLLDEALEVFRSQRTGALSFIGTHVNPEPGPSADGMWFVRMGLSAFTYRFQG